MPPSTDSNPLELAEIVIPDGNATNEVYDFQNRTIRGNVVVDIPKTEDFPRLLFDGMHVHGSIILRGGKEKGDGSCSRAEAQINARGIHVERSILIENADIEGINLNNATIGGDLRITACRLRSHNTSQERDALRARDLKVAGSIMIRGSGKMRSHVEGRIFLAGAEVGGTLEFSGLKMEGLGTKRRALTLANADIGGDVAWVNKKHRGGSCELHGEAKLDSARIGGRLRIGLVGKQALVSIRACEIDAALQIYSHSDNTTSVPVDLLRVDAGDASMDAILLHGYDKPSWNLDIRGAAYQGLAGLTDAERKKTNAPVQSQAVLAYFHKNVVKRSATDQGNFSPQPYQQYIRLCREHGHNDEADLAIAEWIANTPKRGAFIKGLYHGFGLLSHYGLKPWRVTWVYVVAILVCAAAIGLAQWKSPSIFVDPQLEGDLIAGTVDRARASKGAPSDVWPFKLKFVNGPPDASFECAKRINPVVYALDVMLPLAAFGQEAQCPLRGRTSQPWFRDNAFWASLVFAMFRIAGTIMLALALLTFSGINRRIWR